MVTDNQDKLSNNTNAANTTSDVLGQPVLVSASDINENQGKIDFLKRHLQYEYDMLNLTVDSFCFLQEPKSKLSGPIKGAVLNALIESFLVHFRALYDFLELPRYDKNGREFIPPSRDDDVVASHYISNWQDVRPDSSGLLKLSRKRVDKELVHITDKRQTDPIKKQWPIVEIGKEIRKYIELFCEEAEKQLNQ